MGRKYRISDDEILQYIFGGGSVRKTATALKISKHRVMQVRRKYLSPQTDIEHITTDTPQNEADHYTTDTLLAIENNDQKSIHTPPAIDTIRATMRREITHENTLSELSWQMQDYTERYIQAMDRGDEKAAYMWSQNRIKLVDMMAKVTKSYIRETTPSKETEESRDFQEEVIRIIMENVLDPDIRHKMALELKATIPDE